MQSWENEFYPKPPSDRMSKKAAIKHSIQKWTGLLPKNLKKHGLYLDGCTLPRVEDCMDESLLINGDSCALCVRFIGRKYDDKLLGCAACPLAQSLGNPCDKTGRNRPYTRFLSNHDPKPMLRALKVTLKKVEAGEI